MNCYCAATRRAARGLTRFYEDRLRPVGLTSAQFELLANLHGRKEAAQCELVDAIAADQTTLSRNLKVLMAKGWIRSEPSPKDARRTVYQLTGEGSARLMLAFPLWQGAQQELERRLSQSGLPLADVWTTIGALERSLDTVEAAQDLAG